MIPVLIGLLGFALITTGIAMFDVRLGLVVGGAILVFIAYNNAGSVGEPAGGPQ